MPDTTPRGPRNPFGLNLGSLSNRRNRRTNSQLSNKVEDLQDQVKDLEKDLDDAEEKLDQADDQLRRASDYVAYGQQLHALLVQNGITPPLAPSGFFV